MTPEEREAAKQKMVDGMVAKGHTPERARELIDGIGKTLFGPGGRFAPECVICHASIYWWLAGVRVRGAEEALREVEAICQETLAKNMPPATRNSQVVWLADDILNARADALRAARPGDAS